MLCQVYNAHNVPQGRLSENSIDPRRILRNHSKYRVKAAFSLIKSMVLRLDSEVNSRPGNRGRKKVVEETGGSDGIADEHTLSADLYGLVC